MESPEPGRRSRLPILERSGLDAPAAELFDRVVARSQGAVLRADGGLEGPYNAWLHAPRAGEAILNLGRLLLSESSLGPRLTELAILVVAARWKAEFEWWAHSRRAREAGLSGDVIEAIRDGRNPEGLEELERTIYDACRELMCTRGLADERVISLRGVFGYRGCVELVSLCGFYTLVSFTLNAVDVPLPGGVPPAWTIGQADREGASTRREQEGTG